MTLPALTLLARGSAGSLASILQRLFCSDRWGPLQGGTKGLRKGV